jgi:C-terminal processing protease CtpA/Prc
MRFCLVAAILTMFAPGLVQAVGTQQAPAAAQPTEEHFLKLETLHRELERAMREYNERQMAFARNASVAQRDSFMRAREQLDLARSRLNRELQVMMAREAEFRARQSQSTQQFYFIRPEGMRGAPDTVVFFQPARPTGWLGINFSTRWREERDGAGQVIWRFADYPVIESVEPGSPAERAGILSGDLLVALGGRDVVRGSLPFTQLIQPGAALPIQLRRGGKMRQVTAQVIARPPSTFYASSLAGQPAQVVTVTRGTNLPARSVTSSGTAVQVNPPSGTSTVRLVPVPAAGGSSLVAVAGAELFVLSGDFEPALGVRAGLLVLRVAPATPAARAGILPGDVIVGVNRTATNTPEALRIALEQENSRTATLQLIRRGAAQSVLLRW